MKQFRVGGCVRDELMGQEPNDIDFVITGATPEEMLNLGFTLVGESFPVFLDAQGNEHALARTERKTGKGYTGFITDHSINVTLESDLERRDLSINSMAQTMDGELIIDPFNGQEDIKNKILRHTSDAFAEDPVRVLRIARFNARFGKEWTIAPETVELVKGMVKDGVLHELVPERVFKELEKALATATPSIFFTALDELGALDTIFPEFTNVSLELIVEKLDNNNLNPLHNFGKLMTSLVPNRIFKVNSFIDRLKVPNIYIDAQRLWRKIDNLFSLKMGRDDILIGRIIEDLVVTNKRICDESLMKIMTHSLDSAMGALMFECKRKCDAIRFFNLGLEQMNNLKGSDIGEALKKLKIETITESIHEHARAFCSS